MTSELSCVGAAQPSTQPAPVAGCAVVVEKAAPQAPLTLSPWRVSTAAEAGRLVLLAVVTLVAVAWFCRVWWASCAAPTQPSTVFGRIPSVTRTSRGNAADAAGGHAVLVQTVVNEVLKVLRDDRAVAFAEP